jgi:hypothetical protein
MRYKEWTAHDDWLPTYGFQMLKSLPLLKPTYISKRVIDCEKILLGAQSLKARLPEKQHKNFVAYVQAIQSRQHDKCVECRRLRLIEQANPYQNKKLSSAERTRRRDLNLGALKDLRYHRSTAICSDSVTVESWALGVRVQPVPLIPDPPVERKDDGIQRDDSVLWEAMKDAFPLVYQGRKPTKSVRRAPEVGDMMIIIGMGDEPFWVAKLMKLTSSNIELKYYGDGKGFNEKYFPLSDPDKRDRSVHWVRESPRDIAVLDWGFKLNITKRIPISVLKHVSDDQRIDWTYVPRA